MPEKFVNHHHGFQRDFPSGLNSGLDDNCNSSGQFDNCNSSGQFNSSGQYKKERGPEFNRRDQSQTPI